MATTRQKQAAPRIIKQSRLDTNPGPSRSYTKMRTAAAGSVLQQMGRMAPTARQLTPGSHKGIIRRKP